MANVIRLKRASGSDPAASDLVSGEPAVRTDTGELFFKKDDGSIAKVAGAGGGPDFKYLALRNAANNGAASFPNADFTLVTSGTTSAIVPTAANTLLVSVNGVIQKPNTGTSTPSSGFALSGSTIKFGANISAAPDFILYQESGGIGEPSDDTVSEVKLKVSNSPVNGYFLSAQSGNNGGLTWAAPIATSCTGNSATATALATARAINGVNFDGTAAITVTAAAGTLTGNTLNSSVVTSSLTSLGDLSGLTVNGDMALTGANYNVLWDKSDNALEFADNAKATFGAGNDLIIESDGTNGILKNHASGSIVVRANQNILLKTNASDGGADDAVKCVNNGAVELYFDGNKKFETTSSGATVTGSLNLGSGDLLLTGNVDLEDSSGAGNNRIRLGTGDDLQIYHDGTDSRINNATGNLTIAADDIRMRGDGADEHMAKFIKNGAVELYYDNSKKLHTHSGGITISGSIHMDDNNKYIAGTSDDLQIYHDGSHSYLKNNTGSLQVLDGSTEKFRVSGTGTFFKDDIHLSNDGDKINLGASNDLQIYHDGSDSFIKDTGTGGIRIDSNQTVIRNESGSARLEISSDGQINHRYTTSANPKQIYHWSNNRTGMSFRSANTERGNIFFFDSGVQFNTSSDYRLKENVTSISDGITRIKQLIPRKFNWIIDESNTPVDGFLAHEVSSIVPEAVNGTKDAVATQEDVDSGRSQKVGDPIHQMIDHSKLVPLLVAALQEAIGRIEALEAK